jgi:hypothetical protein
VGLVIPLAPFEIHAVTDASAFRLLLNVGVLDIISHVETKGEFVDCNCMLTSVVLESSCEESLREEESRDPEYFGSALLDPFFKEVDSVIAVNDPRPKRFEGKESFLDPSWRDLIVKDSVSHFLQILTHYHLSN